MLMSNAIATHKLSKKYSGIKTYALRDLTISVSAGEVYGFLGANGAGKSTTIRTLMGFMRPTSGSATILGKDITRESAQLKQHVGYLSGEAAFYPKMTGAQFMQYMADLQPPKHTAYVDHLIEVFKAEPSKLIRDLSKGNRQKFGLIQALMHEPDVLILDEPTSGLDPLMQEV
jgi:ABC-2 type transport system ATP-binding protein